MEKSFSLRHVGTGMLGRGCSKALGHSTRCPRQLAATPTLSSPGPFWAPRQHSPPKNFHYTLFHGGFLTSKLLLQQPQHFISAQGNIPLQFSCSAETHLSSPLSVPVGSGEKLNPPLHARWSTGSTPAGQRQGVAGAGVGPSQLGGPPKQPLAVTSRALTASATQPRWPPGKTA